MKKGASNPNSQLLLSGLLCTLITLYLIIPGNAQTQISFHYKSNGLEADSFNVIQNAAHLDDFFERLYQLKVNGNDKVNIVHIGDSHIQADYLTDIVRKNFHRDFGNAGRGLIVPGRVAGTNEPANIRTSSTVPWIPKRCTYPNQPLPIGIGGITISTTQPGARLNVLMSDPLHDYSFSKITLFFQKDKRSFNFSIRDTTDQEFGFMGPHTDEAFVNYASVTLPIRVNEISIQTLKSTAEQSQATIFGIELENNNPGILYHAIGVNGAKYIHYNAALYFARQTQALMPDVFIISLGTNESVDYPYINTSFYSHVEKLITTLKKFNPSAQFVLVTPPEAFRKKIKENPGIEIIRAQLIRYAVENGLAFWDMYKALGGKGSAQAWRKEGLIRPDGVHFSKEGYQYQGDLLYYAMIKSYNEYVAHRHP
jgi:lysophospholipase L1-like esterase